MSLQRLSESVGACVALGFMAGLLLVFATAGPVAWSAAEMPLVSVRAL